MVRTETDSMIEEGGVGEGSVCASVQIIPVGEGGGGYDSQAELDSLWTISSVLVIVFLFFEF